MSRSNYHPGEKRDNCYFCQSWDTEEHHIIPQRFGGPDTRENVVELCNHCHKKMERLYDQQFYEWFGIDDSEGKRMYHRQCMRSGCTEQVTQHWENVQSYDAEFFVCDEHVVPAWHEKDKFVKHGEADE